MYDIIFKDGQPQAGKPGGAMLNTTVSLGRIGLPVSLISEYARDDIGKFIDSFLQFNGVDTGSVDHYSDGQTALAIAVLNDKNEAHYTFYKKYPMRRLEMEFPDVDKDDIILCGSIYAITNEIRNRFVHFISHSAENGGIVIYDPNFRSAHASELNEMKPLIIENMKMASIIRGSDEDFRNIFQAGSPDSVWDIVRNYTGCLVYTSSVDGVYVRTKKFAGKFPVRKISPVSTIGAGDNFNAGMIAALYRNGISGTDLEQMGEEQWDIVVSTGVNFATDVCMSYDNYISAEFAGRFKEGVQDLLS